MWRLYRFALLPMTHWRGTWRVGWYGAAWRAGAWHGALDALQWSVSLCGALQDALTARRGVDVLTWHAGPPGALLAAGDHGAHCLTCAVCDFFLVITLGTDVRLLWHCCVTRKSASLLRLISRRGSWGPSLSPPALRPETSAGRSHSRHDCTLPHRPVDTPPMTPGQGVSRPCTTPYTPTAIPSGASSRLPQPLASAVHPCSLRPGIICRWDSAPSSTWCRESVDTLQGFAYDSILLS